MTPEARDTQGDREALAELLRGVHAEHFVMWHDVEGRLGGDWICSCGKKFGFSDSAIDHVAAEQADALEPVLARARAEALREAADEARFPNLGWEAGGHTSAYSVRRWLRDRADHIDPGADQ